MSYDVFVAVQSRPSEEQVREFLAAQPDVALEGSLRDGENILVTTGSGLPLFLIDPPSRPDSEQLTWPLDSIRPRPRWLMFLSVPAAGGQRGVALALDLAQNLAGLNQGVIHDPQLDEVLGPDGSLRTPRKQVKRRVSILQIQWFFPMHQLSAASAKRFLETAERIMPQVTPRKRAAFEAWAGGKWELRYQSDFDWRGRRPCYEAQASVQTHPEWPAPPGVAAWDISLSLDEDIVRTRAGVLDRVVDLFTSVASALQSFYAAAYVERNLILEGHTLWSDTLSQESERVVIPTWKGLPRQAMWLSWFGPPYRDLVAESLNGLASPYGDGLLLRVGELPADPDQLAPHFPPLPDALTQDSRPVIEITEYSTGYVSRGYTTKHDRAAYIPPLEGTANGCWSEV